MKNKIGIGVITCNRIELFTECIKNIPEVDSIVVVNDGKIYPDSVYPSKVNEIISHKNNKGVGVSKNEAFKYLLDNGCKHIFLSEDDVAIRNSAIIEKYIHASEITGLKHFNFAFHGPGNKDENLLPRPGHILSYGELKVGLFGYLGGAFSYFDANILREVGQMDTRFKNAFEHLDHTLRIIRAGYYSPYYNFADIMDSFYDIEDLDNDLTKSVLRKNSFILNLRTRYYQVFFDWKNGKIPHTSFEKVLTIMHQIHNKYGDKNFQLVMETEGC